MILSDCPIQCQNMYPCRSQWAQSQRRRSAAASLLRLWVRIPRGVLVSYECWVLSGRSLCYELIVSVLLPLYVIWKPKKWGGHNAGWAAAPQEIKIVGVVIRLYLISLMCVWSIWKTALWVSGRIVLSSISLSHMASVSYLAVSLC